MVEKRLFAVFTATCAIGLAVVLDLFRLWRGTDILKYDEKSTDL